MTNALDASGLSKRYGKKTWALRDCSFELPQGRVCALVGPNGAGKTTLLHLATGLLEPTSGTIRVLGDAPAQDPEQLARIGFLAQDAPLYRNFKVSEMLSLGAHLNERWDDAYAKGRLERLGIPLDRKISALSGGQRSQVALAVATGKRPDLLLLDEPLASLDPLARREFVRGLMETVAEEGTTVVLSSHLISDLERVCDHLMILTHGRMRVADDISTLLATHKLIVGPYRARIAGVAEIIEERGSERQTLAVARLDGAVLDPALEARDVELEDLVLAYLGEPPASRLTDASKVAG